MKRILPDDWRVIQRSQITFGVADREPRKDDAAWARAMLRLLDARLKMLHDQMEQLR